MRHWLVGAVVLSLLLFALDGFSVGHAAHLSAHKCSTSSAGKKGKHTMAQASASPVFTFGVTGGNIRPWSVSIDPDGSVQSKGIGVRDQKPIYPTDTLNGLLALAGTEGFWSMPSSTSCTGTLPDIASRFVQITSNTGTTKVSVHGGCNGSFNQLWANLAATVDIEH
jgi:hypothetical protein